MKTKFRLKNANLIATIKVVRDFTGLGLKDSKDLVFDTLKLQRGTNGVGPLNGVITIQHEKPLVVLQKELNKLRQANPTYHAITIESLNSSRKTREGNHVFELPNDQTGELMIEDLRATLNSKRFKLKVERHKDWIGVKIHKAKGSR